MVELIGEFVLKLWCNVWACKLNVNWVVDDEIASLNHVHMYALCFAQKLMTWDVVVDELWWTHDWLLLLLLRDVVVDELLMNLWLVVVVEWWWDHDYMM